MPIQLAFKAGIAASLAMISAQLLQWEYPLYAVIGAIIVMGSTAGSTWSAGIQRLLGTAIGAVAGAIFSSLLGSNAGTLGITVILTILLSSSWGFNEAARLAGYVSSIVILEHSQHPFYYAFGRFRETLLGIGIAWLVNTWLLPSRAAEELRKTLSQLLTNQCKLYQIVFDCYITGDYQTEAINDLKQKIIDYLQQSRELWKEVKKEPVSNQKSLLFDETWEFLTRRIWEHISVMEHAALVRDKDTFWQELLPELTQLSLVTSLAFNNVAEAMVEKDCRLPIPKLNEAVSAATERLNQLQKEEKSNYSLDELLRFFTFFYGMEEIAQKLQKLASRL